MAKTPDPIRVEALARGLARDLRTRAAGNAAGYSAKSRWPYTLAKRGAVKARVETLKRESALADASLTPVIMALMEGARKALDKGDPPSLTAAAKLLAEAARLKQGLAAAPAGDGWLERWGPED